jgi:hypothetical protein
MRGLGRVVSGALWASIGAAAILLAGCASMSSSGGTNVALSGSQEIPRVTTGATGTGTFTVGADRSISGGVMTNGVNGTAAHIHLAAMGQNGPVIVPLTKTSDGVWSVPAGVTLTDAQYEAFKAGNLYVNVHSDANKGGEIRGQLRP